MLNYQDEGGSGIGQAKLLGQGSKMSYCTPTLKC